MASFYGRTMTLRNPGAAPKLFGNLMLGFAVTEAFNWQIVP